MAGANLELYAEAELLSEWAARGRPRVVAGVDGGGTSTECALLPLTLLQGREEEERREDTSGGQGRVEGILDKERVVRSVMGRGRGGASNRNSVGDEKARAALRESVAAALAQARLPWGAVHAVAACMAGVDRPGDVATVSAWLREWFPEPVVVSVHNDALAQLASGTLGRIPGLTDRCRPRSAQASEGVESLAETRSRFGASGVGHLMGAEAIPGDPETLLDSARLADQGGAESDGALGAAAVGFGRMDLPRASHQGEEVGVRRENGTEAGAGAALEAGAEAEKGPRGREGLGPGRTAGEVTGAWVGSSGRATVVVIAGTGSIVYGISHDGRTARASGAGPLLGDRGSGYAIASQALGAVMRGADGRGPPTALTGAILERLALKEPSDLIGWIYSDLAWARVAALLPVVKHCAAQGDPVALRIVSESVEELAQGILAVAAQLGVYPPSEGRGTKAAAQKEAPSLEGAGEQGRGELGTCTVIASGGVIEDRSVLDMFALLKDRLSSVLPGVTLQLPQVDAAVGAALLALHVST